MVFKQTKKKTNTKTSLWSKKLTSEWETFIMNIYVMYNEDNVCERTSLIYIVEGEGPFVNLLIWQDQGWNLGTEKWTDSPEAMQRVGG